MIIPVLLVFAGLISTATSAYCSGKPAEGERVNQFPNFDGPIRFKKSIKNAMLFEAGPLNASFPIVHLWGNPYEIGFAQGTLRKQEIIAFVTKTWAYLSTMLVDALSGERLPKSVKEILVQKGMDRALDWTAEETAPFTSQAIYDELKGLSDATGLSYDLLLRLNMFPELTKASCSFLGAWGTSVKSAGHAYQLRALDYDTVGPFKDFPQLTVYHPTDGGHAYVQVGWPGNVGSLSGFSSEQIAISEIGVSFPDDSFGQGTDNTPPEKVKGQPWMFVLRDVLQYSTDLKSAKDIVASANRTCNLIIGLGSGKDAQSVGVEYSGYVSNFYDDKTLLPVNETWHPQIDNVVYNGMDWLCPGYTGPLGAQLQKYHGMIDENVITQNILPTVQTGNLHAVVYDLTTSKMLISFSRSSSADPSEPEFAYERQFTILHMADVFAQAPPAI